MDRAARPLCQYETADVINEGAMASDGFETYCPFSGKKVDRLIRPVPYVQRRPTAKRCTHPRSYVEYFMILWINLYYTVSHNIYPPQGFLSIFPPTTEYFKIKFYTLIACSHIPNFMQLSLTMTKKLCHIKQDHIENFTFH